MSRVTILQIGPFTTVYCVGGPLGFSIDFDVFNIFCRLDPNEASGALGTQGAIHYFKVDEGSCSIQHEAVYQLQFNIFPEDDKKAQSIFPNFHFEFFPLRPGELLIALEGSYKLLFLRFPEIDNEKETLYLFGAHTGALL